MQFSYSRTRTPLLAFALADLVIPLLTLWFVQALLSSNPWTTSYLLLGLGSGVMIVFSIFVIRGYSRFSSRAFADKLELVFKTWFFIFLIINLVVFFTSSSFEFSRKVIVFWGLLTPIILFVTRFYLSHLFYMTEITPLKVLFLRPYNFTDHELSRLSKQNIVCHFCKDDRPGTLIEMSGDIEPDYVVLNHAGNAESKLIKDLTDLEMQGRVLITMSQFMEAYLRKIYVDYDSSELRYLQDVKPYSTSGILLKRLVDYSASLVVFIITFPLIIYVLYSVKKESPGSVLYRQDRVGFLGKEFLLFKFRSMYPNSESNGAQFAQENDPRIFPFGRFMRSSRADELPQLWNVLKGDLHLVGPRPERKVFTDELEAQIPYYNERHLVRPGITGWAQVMYPYGSCIEDSRQKLMYDLFYIKNWTIWLEVEVLFRTIWIVVNKKGV